MPVDASRLNQTEHHFEALKITGMRELDVVAQNIKDCKICKRKSNEVF